MVNIKTILIEGKNHLILSIDAEKDLAKFQYLCDRNSKLGLEGNLT